MSVWHLEEATWPARDSRTHFDGAEGQEEYQIFSYDTPPAVMLVRYVFGLV